MLAGDTPLGFIRLPTRAAAADVQRDAANRRRREARRSRLADGSTATLNTSSRIVVFYSPLARDVYLSYGEATFDVARDPSRPFNVHAGRRVVQAPGTTFNVRVFPDDNVELTVTEGQVKVLYEPQRPPYTAERLRDDFMHVDTIVARRRAGARGADVPVGAQARAE